MTALLAYGLIILGTLMGAFGSMYLKKGAAGFNLNLLVQLRNTPFIIGASLFLLSSIIYMWALSLEKLSILYPLTSLTYLWVTFLSVYRLGEKFNAKKITGICFIILGIVLITVFRQ